MRQELMRAKKLAAHYTANVERAKMIKDMRERRASKGVEPDSGDASVRVLLCGECGGLTLTVPAAETGDSFPAAQERRPVVGQDRWRWPVWCVAGSVQVASQQGACGCLMSALVPAFAQSA